VTNRHPLNHTVMLWCKQTNAAADPAMTQTQCLADCGDDTLSVLASIHTHTHTHTHTHAHTYTHTYIKAPWYDSIAASCRLRRRHPLHAGLNQYQPGGCTFSLILTSSPPSPHPHIRRLHYGCLHPHIHAGLLGRLFCAT